MRLRRLAGPVFALLALTGVAWANVRLSVPEDIVPPVYVGPAGPAILDGSLFALHDGEWAAIPFYRSPEFIDPDFDLLNDFDPAVFDAPLRIEGFAVFRDATLAVPTLSQVRGLGAVPVWFVRWGELRDAAADGVLRFSELVAMDSLRIGSADFYQEQNHFYGHHPVSHLAIVARDVGGRRHVRPALR
jgi:hypothetical protein